VTKSRFKNFGKKYPQQDFTYHLLIFILYQHLIIYVRNDCTPECIKYYRSSILLAAYISEKLGDFIFMGFSYFKNGITDVLPCKILDFDSYADLILNNPDDSIISQIRKLRSEGNESYRKTKSQQHYITPHCILKYRKLEGIYFDKNFIDFSGYIFYDLDLDLKNSSYSVDEYKLSLIEKYSDVASIIAKSISGGGITICFKIKNRIETIDQFNSALSFITTNILHEEINHIDENLYRVGQPLHITSDPDAFIDYNNDIEVNFYYPSIIEKSIKEYILGYNIDNIPIDTFLHLSLKELLKYVRLVTDVSVSNRIVDLKQVEVAKIHFRKKKIENTKKHKSYTAVIHALVYLNPDIHPAYLFAYLCYYNQVMADPPMVYEKIESLFRFVYNSIMDDKENDNYNYSKVKTKWVHTNKFSGIAPIIRNRIANDLNGKRRTNTSIKIIFETKKQLKLEGIKVTQNNVAARSGISIATVKRHYKKIPIDLDEYVKELNCYTSEDFIQMTKKTKEIKYDLYHPECPIWAIKQEDLQL
jgi:hypothetical protein